MNFNLILILILGVIVHSCLGGKILFYFPFSAPSIPITYKPIVQELQRRNHEVYIVQAYETDMIPPDRLIISQSSSEKEISKFMDNLGTSGKGDLKETMKIMESSSKLALTHPLMRKWLRDPETKFDAVMCFSLTAHIAEYLAFKFNASKIHYFPLLSTLDLDDDKLGTPNNPALHPNFLLPFQHDAMTFFQRLSNLFLISSFRLYNSYVAIHFNEEKYLNSFLPPPYNDPRNRPRLAELSSKSSISLALSHGHPLMLDGYRPLMPNQIYIGMIGCHKKFKESQIPPKMLKFIDEASNGFIFISFGSVMKAVKMDEDKRRALILAFKSLPQRVIWKWETEDMPDKPDNVYLTKWAPQQELLAHPKLKLFISHAGLSSFQEALCHQKPVLYVPIRADQFFNSMEGVNKGFALKIPYSDLSSESHDKIVEKINRLINEPIFEEKAKYWGELVTDEITHPLDRAIWWIEYVMRYPKTPQFKRQGQHLNWFQINLLDLYAFIILIVVIISYLLKIIICKCLSCCHNNKKSSNNKIKDN